MEKPDFELMSWEMATKEWGYLMNIPHEDMALAMERIWEKYVEPQAEELTRAHARIEELEKQSEELRDRCKLYYHLIDLYRKANGQ